MRSLGFGYGHVAVALAAASTDDETTGETLARCSRARCSMTFDRFGQPYGSSWAGMSMGEGRKVHGGEGMGTMYSESCSSTKSPSPDGYHHWTAVSNVQSVEHFVCDHCDHEFSD